MHRHLLASLRRVTQADRAGAIALLIVQLLTALVAGAEMVLVGRLIERVDGGHPLATTIAALLGARLLVSLLGVVDTERRSLVSERLAAVCAHEVASIAVRAEPARHDDPAFNDRMERAAAQVEQASWTTVWVVVESLGTLATAAVTALVIARVEPLLVLAVAIGLVPAFAGEFFLGRRRYQFEVGQTENDRRRSNLFGIVTSSDHARELRLFGAGPRLVADHDAAYDRRIGALRHELRRRRSLVGITTVASAMVLTATLSVGAVIAERRDLGVAALGTLLVAMQQLVARLRTLSGGLGAIRESMLFLDDLTTLAAEAGPEQSASRPMTAAGVRVRGLSFTYPGTDRQVLTDIDLDIAPGEIVALVGENGCGKTTLARLVCGLYAPTAGEVLVGGVSTSGSGRGQVLASTTALLQDHGHYELSLRTNVALGDLAADHDETRLRDAIAQAGLDEAVAALPRGLDTVLSREFTDGRDLSGGQWQRVGLARALFRDAPLVILDEPTSALDPRAEAALFSSLRGLLLGRTGLVISHRLTSLQGVDRIVVLDAGRVVEQGTHDELLDADGFYASLHRIQLASTTPTLAANRP